MKINKKWLKDNFEQKFYRLTNKCEFSVKRVGSEVNSPYNKVQEDPPPLGVG